MTSKKEEAQKAARIIYEPYAEKILAMPEGQERDEFVSQLHEMAIATALAIDPEIRKGAITQAVFGSVMSMAKARQPQTKTPDPSTRERPPASSTAGETAATKTLPNGQALPADIPLKPIYKPGELPGQATLKDQILPAARKNIIDTTLATFDAVASKIFLDDYRRALFDVWKAKHKYEGDLGDFMISAFDEFFALRGVKMVYEEREPVIRPEMSE